MTRTERGRRQCARLRTCSGAKVEGELSSYPCMDDLSRGGTRPLPETAGPRRLLKQRVPTQLLGCCSPFGRTPAGSADRRLGGRCFVSLPADGEGQLLRRVMPAVQPCTIRRGRSYLALNRRFHLGRGDATRPTATARPSRSSGWRGGGGRYRRRQRRRAAFNTEQCRRFPYLSRPNFRTIIAARVSGYIIEQPPHYPPGQRRQSRPKGGFAALHPGCRTVRQSLAAVTGRKCQHGSSQSHFPQGSFDGP